MNTLNLIAVLLILSFTNCKKEGSTVDDPGCMDQLIEEFKNSDMPCESGKTIYRYKFQDQFVYVFGPGNCGADMMSDVYDEECNLICGLGGIAGNQSCEGENFHEGATEETLIWKN